MSTRTEGTDHGRPDRSLYPVPVVKRFILSGVFFLILNIWFLLEALKNGFFRGSYNKVDYSPDSRGDSFSRSNGARISYQRAIQHGYKRKTRRPGHWSWSSSKASTLETCDSGYSADRKFDSWTDTSASEKRCSDSSVQTSFWWKNESDKPRPLTSSTTANTKLPDSDGTTSDTDDDVFFVPRSQRLPTKETVPVGNCRPHAAKGPVLSSEILQPLMSNPSHHRGSDTQLHAARGPVLSTEILQPLMSTPSHHRGSDTPREIYVAALHIHAASVQMGVERVGSLFANHGPSPYCCVTVRQNDICQSDGDIYEANMDWV